MPARQCPTTGIAHFTGSKVGQPLAGLDQHELCQNAPEIQETVGHGTKGVEKCCCKPFPGLKEKHKYLAKTLLLSDPSF